MGKLFTLLIFLDGSPHIGVAAIPTLEECRSIGETFLKEAKPEWKAAFECRPTNLGAK